MPNPIPTSSRVALGIRSAGRCERCGGHGYQAHHRRRRRVKDEHTHHPGNLVHLCAVCHAWCHANPRLAIEAGLIVEAHNGDPCAEPMQTINGERTPDCIGGWR